MVFSLLSIPPHLQLETIQKCEGKDYVNLQKTSFHALEMSELIKRNVPLNVKKLLVCKINSGEVTVFPKEFSPETKGKSKIFQSLKRMDGIRTKKVEKSPDQKISYFAEIIVINNPLNDEFTQKLIETLSKTKSFARKVVLKNTVSCAPETFDNLLKACKATELDCFEDLPAVYYQSKVVQNLLSLFLNSEINDNDFLGLKCAKMELECYAKVTSKGLNLFLKEWLQGNREILQIIIYGNFQLSDIFEDIENEDGEDNIKIVKRSDGKTLEVVLTSNYISIFLL